MKLLEGLRVVSTALNLPGPVACARLAELGAAVTKVEPPTGDPFAGYCGAWYERLHAGVEVRTIDLKGDEGRRAMQSLLEAADLLLTAQRPAALARMGLDAAVVATLHPRLCQVAITGHAPPDDGTAGHDLTYMAVNGLVVPPALPATLFADMAGAERAVSTALALVMARDREGRGGRATVALADAARYLAQPLREGLTRPAAMLGGGLAGYNIYATRAGWIAVAALEPHFARRLAESLGLPALTEAGLRDKFLADTAMQWERWARALDLPLVALRTPFTENVC